MTDLVTFDQMLRDYFPPPGVEPPEYVKRARAERAELERTGKRVRVEPHLDNTGMPCREVGPASLVHDLGNHDCCYVCNEHADRVERIESGALPRILQASDWRAYSDGGMVANWYAWCAMWGEITELRARAFEADRVMFEDVRVQP